MKLKTLFSVVVAAGVASAYAGTARSSKDASGCGGSYMSQAALGNSYFVKGGNNCVGKVAVNGAMQMNVGQADPAGSSLQTTTYIRANNANMFFSSQLSNNWKGFLNVAYVDNDPSYSTDDLSGTATVSSSNNTVNFDEIKAAYEDDLLLFTIGHMYGSFGEYANPYAPLPSASQAFEQFDNDQATLGVKTSLPVRLSLGLVGNDSTNKSSLNVYTVNAMMDRKFGSSKLSMHGSFINDYKEALLGDGTAEESIREMRAPAYKTGASSTSVDTDNFHREGAYSLHARLDMPKFYVAGSYDHVAGEMINANKDTKPTVVEGTLGTSVNAAGTPLDVSATVGSTAHGDEVFSAKTNYIFDVHGNFNGGMTAGVQAARYVLNNNMTTLSNYTLNKHTDIAIAYMQYAF